MSEDRVPYKPIGQLEKLSELDRMKRAIMVHKEWIWSDGLRIVKLSSRVDTLEKEMADVKSVLERVLKPSEN